MADGSLDELYQELILDHYKNPRCAGCPAHSDCHASLFNPLCGDQIELGLCFCGDTVQKIGFAGRGCSISQASASMMSSLCEGKKVEEVKGLCENFRSMMRGVGSAGESEKLGDAVALEGVRKFSARVKCAMLAWEALEKCIGKEAEGQKR